MTNSAAPPTESERGANAQESLSQLLAKILDQLSLSAWLPAGVVVAIGVVYGSLRMVGGDAGRTVSLIASIGWTTLFLLIGSVVLMTMVTQAFEFEAIRLLEGYWGAGRTRSLLCDAGCTFHTWRRRRLRARRDSLERRAFAVARLTMLERGVPRHIVNILEADITGDDNGIGTDEEQTAARYLGWHSFARPAAVRRLSALDVRLLEYPSEDHRVLPTRLGNTLRSFEERAHDPKSGSLEGMVVRVFHQLPLAIQSEHDQYRTRLDLYCSMVIVFLLASAAAYPVLGWSDWRVPAVAVAVGLGLALLSYRAAIASARPYGIVLETIGRYVQTRPDLHTRAASPG